MDVLAEQIAEQVDQILGRQWERHKGEFALPVLEDEANAPSVEGTVQATCSCGSGIPIQKVVVNGQEVMLIALPVILQQSKEAGKAPGAETVTELLDALKIYNPIREGEEQAYREMLLKEYSEFFEKELPQ